MLAAKLGLIYAQQLWTVMTKSFANTALAPAAIPIIEALIEQDFECKDNVPNEFHIFCRQVIMACAEGIWSTVTARLNETKGFQGGRLTAEWIRKRRRAWITVAKIASDLHDRLSREDMMELLYTPLG